VLFNVRSLPTVKAFTNGQVVAEFVGAQPEERLRDFLSRIAPPGRFTLALEKGASLLFSNEWNKAEMVFREVLEQNPDLPVALLGMAKALLAQNKVRETLLILRTFPASKLYNQAQLLLPLADTFLHAETGSLPAETDLDAAFQSAIRLAGRGNIPAALDGLLDILRQEKGYRQGLARQVFLALLELPGDESEFTRQYRTELASVLF
jgi:putative thioredoxin